MPGLLLLIAIPNPVSAEGGWFAALIRNLPPATLVAVVEMTTLPAITLVSVS